MVSLYANYAYTRATFRSEADIFSIRADDNFAGAPLSGENAVEIGDRLPLVPEHQIKAGALLHLPHGIESAPTPATPAASGCGGTKPTKRSRCRDTSWPIYGLE